MYQKNFKNTKKLKFKILYFHTFIPLALSNNFILFSTFGAENFIMTPVIVFLSCLVFINDARRENEYHRVRNLALNVLKR